jgi:hypothetical protein
MADLVYPVPACVGIIAAMVTHFPKNPLPFLLATSLTLLTAVHGGIHYVDATTGAAGNTTLADGSVYTPPLNGSTGADNQWEQRTVFGSGGTIYEAGGENATENAPELKTMISGLTPGQHYNIHVYFWDPGSTTEDWNIRAGFVSNPGGNPLYSAADATAELGGALAAQIASTLTHSNPPTVFAESARNLLAGFVGNTAANAMGEIEVFIDDLPAATTVNRRTWYDGLGYEAAAPPNTVNYVDASLSNTSRWDGLAFAPAPDGVTGADHNWEQRNLGNGGTVFEANFEAPEDAPLLVTTLSGLTPDTEYVLYSYFWTDGSNWRIKASTKVSDIQNNGTPSFPGDDFLPSSPSTHFAASNHASQTATVGTPATGTAFTLTPLLAEGNRTLIQANLGTATSDENGALKVYIDDFADGGPVPRTWYDGLGYKLALPLDPELDEDTDGLTNGQEAALGTNPYLVDSDGDAYSDKAEVDAGSDPLDAASIPPLPGNAMLIAHDGAWTWFNDERAIFHQDSLFTGYVQGDGQYGVTRYDPAAHETFPMILSTAASRQQDDHNNPSITVLPDGRLLALYAKHLGGSQFYQRTSLVPLPSSAADWGPEIIHPLPANNTYNNTYLLSAENKRIYNFHRCINFNPTITISNDLGATWETPVPFIAVGTNNTRPYPRYCSNRTDRIDLIYTDGHPRDVNNSVYHMFYRDGSFHKTNGSVIDTIGSLPLDHQGGERGSTIYPFSSAAWGPGQGPDDWIPNARGWTWDVHYGADGNPVCVFQVQTGTDATWDSSRIFYYYARWTGTDWQRRFIAQGGRGIYAAESDYGGGMTLDPDHPNVVYISTNAANPFTLDDVSNVPLRPGARFEIFRGTTSDGGLTFSWEQITFASEADNLRPIVPENHGYDRALLWFNGTYSTYSNFNTRVLGILENQLQVRKWSCGPTRGSLTWASSPGDVYRITGSADLTGFPIPAATGILSQGAETTYEFEFPPPLRNAQRAFFRVETE